MEISNYINSEKKLRELYDAPMEGALKKQKNHLNDDAKQFIEESPFLCIATSNHNASSDCSPKGDAAGFVKILNEKMIAIPDRKGNNRLDSLVNILNYPKVGIIFMIPSRYETLRVNGRAKLTSCPQLMEQLAFKGKQPTTAIIIEIDEVYFHCPKALIRAKLWKDEMEAKDLHSYSKIRASVWDMKLNSKEVESEARKYKDSLKDKLY